MFFLNLYLSSFYLFVCVACFEYMFSFFLYICSPFSCCTKVFGYCILMFLSLCFKARKKWTGKKVTWHKFQHVGTDTVSDEYTIFTLSQIIYTWTPHFVNQFKLTVNRLLYLSVWVVSLLQQTNYFKYMYTPLMVVKLLYLFVLS